MPKKRSTYWSRNKKEKQLTTARLIEISLKVDGHIYSHQPITETDAKKYLNEVISYKELCSGDERSLQVIEKLSRCMNAVIIEHKELRGDICKINDGRSVQGDDVRASSLSPVYSISDEDRTQLTQMAMESAKNNTEANKDVEIIDLSNIDDDEIHDNNITNTNTVDCVNSVIHVEVDIYRAISNLSIKDLESLPEIITSDADYSQSILNNFEAIDNLGQHNIKYGTPKETITEGLKEFGDTNIKKTHVLNDDKTINNTNNINNVLNNSGLKNHPNESSKLTNSNAPITSKNKTVSQDTDPKNIFNTTSVAKAPCRNNEQLKPKAFYPCKETPDSQKQTWYDSDRTCTINSSRLQDTTHIQLPAQIYNDVNSISNTFNKTGIPINRIVDVQDASAIDTARTNSKNDKTINNVTIINENSNTIKKKRGPRKKKVLTEEGVKPKNKTTNRNPKHAKKKLSTNLSQQDKNVPIYNKNVENDLSWIENIRYVREIKEDEHDSNMILEESFWDNYYLPGNWNEYEFL